MEKTYKRVPFDIELAKKIQSGKVEGRIVNVTTEEVSYTKCGSTLIDTHKDKFIELLEKSPKYEFKVGDKVRIHAKVNPENTMYNGEVGEVVDVLNNVLHVRVGALPFAYLKEECELVESAKLKHGFKPFDKVLVRDCEREQTHWTPAIFQETDDSPTPYMASGLWWKECIPYEGNEDLVGTINN